MATFIQTFMYLSGYKLIVPRIQCPQNYQVI